MTLAATNNYSTLPLPPLEGEDRGEGGPNFALTLALSRGGRGNILNAGILLRTAAIISFPVPGEFFPE